MGTSESAVVGSIPATFFLMRYRVIKGILKEEKNRIERATFSWGQNKKSMVRIKMYLPDKNGKIKNITDPLGESIYSKFQDPPKFENLENFQDLKLLI